MENVNIAGITFLNPVLVNPVDEENSLDDVTISPNSTDETTEEDVTEKNIIKKLCYCFYKVL
jgi:hypothetical protein